MNSNGLSVIILRRWGFNNVKVVRFFIKQEDTLTNKYVEIRRMKKRLTKRVAGEVIMRKNQFAWNMVSDDLFLEYINRFVSVDKYIITKRYKIT